MATLAEQAICPFRREAGMVQATVSITQLSEVIAARQETMQEERLTARLEVCKMKVSQLVEAHVTACQLTPQAYALLLQKCDGREFIRSIVLNMAVDPLSEAVSKWAVTELEDYFGIAVSRPPQLRIAVQQLLPAVDINQMLQEYMNTQLITQAMGRAVNKACRKSLLQISLPGLVRCWINKMEFGSILLGAVHCHPEEQRTRLYQQIILCSSGMICQLKFQVKKQFYEQLLQIFYQFYDERALKLSFTIRQKRWRKKWLKHRKPAYLYQVKEAV